jgi:MFS family permease
MNPAADLTSARRSQGDAPLIQPPFAADRRNAPMTTTKAARSLDAAGDAPTRVRWRIFVLMLMLIAINYIDRASISVAMPVISKEFDIGLATQGFILSSFFITYALMQIPGGMLADRFKPRIVIAAATLGWGFFQAIAAVSTTAWILVLTRLGLGASEAPIYPAGGKLNAIWMAPSERARGATLLDGGAPLGAALGSAIIAGLIGEFGSWRLSFVVAGAGPCSAASLHGGTSAIIPRSIPRSTRPRSTISPPPTLRRTHFQGLRRGPTFGPISAIAPSGACVWAGCSSTPSSTGS